MAKSLRAHCKKRARTAMRETVGTRAAEKVLRKTTRSTLRGLLAAGGSEAALRSILGGAGGASARLVTLEPVARRALPYTFNAPLRAARVEGAIEDDTDDEAAERAAGAKDERGELLHSEPAPTGAKTAGTAPVFRGLAAAGDDGAGAGADGAPEPGGALRAFDKPVGKREMSSSYHAWQVLDKVNPVAGFYEVPAGKSRKKNKKTAPEPFFPKPRAGKW